MLEPNINGTFVRYVLCLESLPLLNLRHIMIWMSHMWGEGRVKYTIIIYIISGFIC
jgi:hypothetical protein